MTDTTATDDERSVVDPHAGTSVLVQRLRSEAVVLLSHPIFRRNRSVRRRFNGLTYGPSLPF